MEELTAEVIEIEDKTELIDNIMTMYGQEILQLVYSYVNNKEIAEELTQDIFVKCYNSLHTFKGKSTIRTWLWRIAINHSKDYLKSWYNKNVINVKNENVFDLKKRESVEVMVIRKDDEDRLVSSVMNLPIIYREVIYLFYFEELTIKEISNIIQVKQNTVKTRLRRAKELLKQELEDSVHGG
ncbi:sigma-70 family RNA polymerase sigma factor [Niallia sp. Sow4_A1]|uniref:sigma-70 family RNA polymerase sigma factor n=1 Tax=Niallia sp. Sow4_A1 TaxID=3438793 RepID=UPI003F97BFE4